MNTWLPTPNEPNGSTWTNNTVTNSPLKEPEIKQQLDRQEVLIDQLKSCIGGLSQRIEPILARTQEVKDAHKLEVPPSLSSPLGDTIALKNDRLQMLVNMLRDITEKVEV